MPISMRLLVGALAFLLLGHGTVARIATQADLPAPPANTEFTITTENDAEPKTVVTLWTRNPEFDSMSILTFRLEYRHDRPDEVLIRGLRKVVGMQHGHPGFDQEKSQRYCPPAGLLMALIDEIIARTRVRTAYLEDWAHLPYNKADAASCVVKSAVLFNVVIVDDDLAPRSSIPPNGKSVRFLYRKFGFGYLHDHDEANDERAIAELKQLTTDDVLDVLNEGSETEIKDVDQLERGRNFTKAMQELYRTRPEVGENIIRTLLDHRWVTANSRPGNRFATNLRTLNLERTLVKRYRVESRPSSIELNVKRLVLKSPLVYVTIGVIILRFVLSNLLHLL